MANIFNTDKPPNMQHRQQYHYQGGLIITYHILFCVSPFIYKLAYTYFKDNMTHHQNPPLSDVGLQTTPWNKY